MKEIDTNMRASLKRIINNREKAMNSGEVLNNDLLGMLLESNRMEMQEHGNKKTLAMTSQEVIEECNAFYIAGQETTSTMLVWTMVLLSRFPNWQARAREEILHAFGNQKPDYDGLSHLKIVSNKWFYFNDGYIIAGKMLTNVLRTCVKKSKAIN